MCETKAEQLCSAKGYYVVSKNGENVGNISSYDKFGYGSGYVSGTGTNNNANYSASSQASFLSIPLLNRTMTIVCKG